MFLLVASVATVLVVSALCSLTEAALYSVRTPYVRQLADSGSRAGKLLVGFKRNMERPITAILIINTVANTAGSAVAGYQAAQLFGDVKCAGFSAVLVFSGTLTLSVLLFSEILPKVAGVSYGNVVARWISVPLSMMIWIMLPLVWLVQGVARLVQRDSPAPIATEEEVYQIALLSAEEGSILPLEAALVRNVLQLNEITAREIMTPRTVVYTLASSTPLAEIRDELAAMPYTRIPIYRDGPDDWIGQVLKPDILACLARDEFETSLETLRKPLVFVPETLPGHRLLSTFLAQREHLLGVVDEYGGVLGVVSLEDVLESLIGQEIVDETDLIVDLQKVARSQGTRRLRSLLAPRSEKKPS